MGAVVVQAFPSFHGLNARSLAFAFIIVVHLALYAAFTSLHSPPVLVRIPPYIDTFNVPDQPQPPERKVVPIEGQHLPTGPFVPTDIELPKVPIDPAIWEVDPPRPDPIVPTHERSEPTPAIVAPSIDPRVGLREPVYPASEIRLNHTGTVVLSVQVLRDGKVGDVRVVRSTGYPKLDEAALRVARTWRLIPGTRDGAAVTMWKEVPITFQLRN
jgi:protein TonB